MSAKTAEVFLSYVQSHVPAGVAVRIKTETQESLKAALDDAEN